MISRKATANHFRPIISPYSADDVLKIVNDGLRELVECNRTGKSEIEVDIKPDKIKRDENINPIMSFLKELKKIFPNIPTIIKRGNIVNIGYFKKFSKGFKRTKCHIENETKTRNN